MIIVDRKHEELCYALQVSCGVFSPKKKKQLWEKKKNQKNKYKCLSKYILY